jgi:hypothetical protein
MKSFSRLTLIAVFTGTCLFSCIKKPSRKEIEENLKTAMELNLNHHPGTDTATLKFKVLNVFYYEEKSFYTCEFKVNMKQKTPEILKDTTGTMKAEISKDFQTVTRKY